MSKTVKDPGLNKRLKSLIVQRFGDRGRFSLLEQASGISESKWKNAYYEKQNVPIEIVEFWVKKYPEDEVWLKTGQRAPNQADFPFNAPVPRKRDSETVGARLNWVISEFAAPSGEALFKYLEQRSGGKILASQWLRAIMRLEEPTMEMIQAICTDRPMFTEWVILGEVLSSMSVDPTDEESVSAWKRKQAEAWDKLQRP